jgi:ribonuclease BN (tRNA processing enzyme)
MTAVPAAENRKLTVTFAGSGDAFGSGGRYQACIHLQRPGGLHPVLLDCGATSLSALKHFRLDPGEVEAVFVSHLHGDHFGGLPFLILDGQFSRRTAPLTIAGPPGITRRLTDAMECMFPGSSATSRRFEVRTVEINPGATATVAGIGVTAWEVNHPSGAPSLALRLDLAGKTVAYTGDTAWTDALIECSAGADLLIAEAYFRDKNIPYHLRQTDLNTHRDRLSARRIVLTHMSADMLDHPGPVALETAHDGLSLTL